VKDRRLDLLVEEREVKRRVAVTAGPTAPPRGYRRLYAEHVLQADAGCDFDFLRASPRGPHAERAEHDAGAAGAV
jgi:dihydroxy-acid dehydratase